jgi:hypothetical protein
MLQEARIALHTLPQTGSKLRRVLDPKQGAKGATPQALPSVCAFNELIVAMGITEEFMPAIHRISLGLIVCCL